MPMISPDDLKIGQYSQSWMATVLPTFPSRTKQRDFNSCLQNRILPYFGQMTFSRLTKHELKRFVSRLTCHSGPKVGRPLSRGSCVKIISVLRTLWNDACDEFNWCLRDPFQNIWKSLPPKSRSQKPKIFRFDDWTRLLAEMDPHYRPVTEFMLRTGLTATEVERLAKCDIHSGLIHVNSRLEKHAVMTLAKIREIPITSALQKLIDRAFESSQGGALFPMKNGADFNGERFRKSVWRKAFNNAGLELRPSYTIRNSFAAWSLAIGIHPAQIARIMGLSTPQVLYEKMGFYTTSLEPDTENIRTYFGDDFPKNNSSNYHKMPAPKDNP